MYLADQFPPQVVQRSPHRLDAAEIGDAADLARAMVYWLEHPAERQTAAVKIRERAHRLFTPETAAAKLRAWLREGMGR